MAPGNDCAGEHAGEPPRPEQTPTPPPNIDFAHLYKVFTPEEQTRKSRLTNLRQKIMAIIGYATCLVTGIMHIQYILEAFHVVPRSLHATDWIVYCCFREAIGIIIEGRRVLNLDYSGNVDMIHEGLHKIYDGPSVLKNQLGQGEFSLVPHNLDWHVKHITAEENRGKDYRELYPELKHTYDVYGFTNNKHCYGQYSNPPRTYDHLNEESRLLLDRVFDALRRNAKVSEEDALRGYNVLMGSCAPQASDEDPTLHVLRPGYQGHELPSHLNPVFAIFDYVLKMKYRILDHPDQPKLKEAIPAEDITYFRRTLWPALRHWFEPENDKMRENFEREKREAEDKANVRTNLRKAQTDVARRSAPMAAVLAPRALTHSGLAPPSHTTVEHPTAPASTMRATESNPCYSAPPTPRDIEDEDAIADDGDEEADEDGSDYGDDDAYSAYVPTSDFEPRSTPIRAPKRPSKVHFEPLAKSDDLEYASTPEPSSPQEELHSSESTTSTVEDVLTAARDDEPSDEIAHDAPAAPTLAPT
ncbi:hypothetical protein HDZ31DRAFT_76716, partial [Schizophyllum fasciatum]